MSTTSCGAYVCTAGTACLTSCNYARRPTARAATTAPAPNGTCAAKKAPGQRLRRRPRVHQRQLRRRRLLQRLRAAAPARRATYGLGTCANVANGRGRAARPLPGRTRPAATPASAPAAPARQGAAGTDVRRLLLHDRDDLPARRHCTGSGHLLDPGHAELLALHLRDAAAAGRGCADDSQCVAGTYCNGGSCVAQAGPRRDLRGATTSARTGHCTDGVCCGVGACPSCQTCAVPAAQGTCHNVLPGGADPTRRARPGRRELRHQRPLQRRRQLRSATTSAPSA